MKVYIAGKITGDPNYKARFAAAQATIEGHGHAVMNPALLPEGFEHHEYMKVCYAMIDICDAIFFLPNWKDSKGAKMEHDYGEKNGKSLMWDYRVFKVAEAERTAKF